MTIGQFRYFFTGKILNVVPLLLLTCILYSQINTGTGYYKINFESQGQDFDRSVIEQFQEANRLRKIVIFFDSTRYGTLEYGRKGELETRAIIDYKNNDSYVFENKYHDSYASTIYSYQKTTTIPTRDFEFFRNFHTSRYDLEKSDSVFIIEGYKCSKYLFTIKGSIQIEFYVTDLIKLPIHSEVDLSDFRSKFPVKVCVHLDGYSFIYKLDKFNANIDETQWFSTDTTGLVSKADFKKQQKITLHSEKKNKIPEGILQTEKGINIDIAKALFQNKLLYDFVLNDIERKNHDVDRFSLISRIQTDHFRDVPDSIELRLLESGVISPEIFEKYKMQFPDKVAYSTEASMFFLRNQLLSEELKNKSARSQLIKNLRQSSILDITHQKEIDHKFIEGQLDFSEYLVELGYLKVYPHHGYMKLNHQIADIVKEYLGLILPELASEIIVEENKSATDLIVKVFNETYYIDILKSINQDTNICEAFRDRNFRIKSDSVYVDGKFYSKLNSMAIQIGCDNGIKVSISNIIVPGFFDIFRTSGMQEWIISEFPEWKLFKHEYAFRVLNSAKDESIPDRIPAFMPIEDKFNHSYIQHLGIPHYFAESYLLTSAQKRQLLALGSSLNKAIGYSTKFVEESMQNLITDEKGICYFLPGQCVEISFHENIDPSKNLKNIKSFKRGFPDIYKVFSGDFNPTKLRYDDVGQVISMRYKKKILSVKTDMHLRYNLLKLIAGEMNNEGKILLYFSGSKHYNINFLFPDDQLLEALKKIMGNRLQLFNQAN